MQKERILWKHKNHGALSQIAKKVGVSRTMVTDVFYGRRTSEGCAIERRLAKLGAPGFEQYRKEESCRS